MFTTWRIVRPLRARLAPFARFVERGGGRAFKGSEVDLTSRRRYRRRAEKERNDARANICQIYDLIGRGSAADESRYIDESSLFQPFD